MYSSLGVARYLYVFLCVPFLVLGSPGGKKNKRIFPGLQDKSFTIRRNLEVWGYGSFDGSLTLSNPHSGILLHLDPLEGEIRADLGNEVESLWFEPGFIGLSGGLALGDADAPWAGLIRWTGEDFEGFNGRQWVSLSAGSGFESSPASRIRKSQVAAWDKAFSWGDHNETPYLLEESDPLFVGSPASQLTVESMANFETAYRWGNHRLAGYLVSEADPAFHASPASGITTGQTARWDMAHSWGNHARVGYLRRESDPALQMSEVGAVPFWGGETLLEGPIRVIEDVLVIAADSRVSGNLKVEGETEILRLKRQGDIFMGPYGRPEDAGPPPEEMVP